MAQGGDAPDVLHQAGELAQPGALQGAAASTEAHPDPMAGIRWLPGDVLGQVLGYLDGPSRRSFRGTDHHALRMERAQRHADRLLAVGRWAGSIARLSDVSDRLAALPVAYRPRVLDAVAERIEAIGGAARPAMRAVIDHLLALPSAFRLEATSAALLVLREWRRPLRVLETRDPTLERCAAALGAAASQHPPSAVMREVRAVAAHAGDEARKLEQEGYALASDIARADEGARVRFDRWLGDVDALMPLSARVPALKACAFVWRFIADADAWSALGRVIASLSADERAEVIGEALANSQALTCFDVVLGLVADLPLSHRDTPLAALAWKVLGTSGEQQAELIQAISEVAERESPMVFKKTALSLIMVMDFLHTPNESLVREHADRMLARLPLSARAAFIADVASRRTMAARLWALSKLPELAQAQAQAVAHAVAAEPDLGGVIPYRAEIVRRLVVGMTGNDNMPPPLQMDQVWPALCEALRNIEEDAREFPLAALRELAPHLPEPQRVQAYAIAAGRAV